MERESPKYLTPREVAEVFRVNLTTIYRQVANGKLHPFKVGRAWRFHREEIEKVLTGPRKDPSHSN